MSQSYSCRGCGYVQETRWKGPCPNCKIRWAAVPKGPSNGERRVTAAQSIGIKVEHIATGHEALDYVLSGGIVKGGVIAFSGVHGGGKTTLLVKALDNLITRTGKPVLYASGEESNQAVLAACDRVGVVSDKLEIMGSTRNIQTILARCDELKPLVTVFDSLQPMSLHGEVKPTATENEAAAQVIIDHCERTKMCAIIIMHMTKELESKGSTEVPHMASTELMLYKFSEKDDGDPEEIFGKKKANSLDFDKVRTLMVGKNRHGEELRKTFLLMGERGLEPLARKSKLELV